ncbi:hypothetical protein NP493_207g02024 [Ridgeia piscesae]|uniref:Uncharacterized protein n=1 Tax=Ridgeia piscesae TaxID=27915 RepID=A0AAD9P1J9_RIDPI|nr:hypothetical protein NP493_207g02024 [Ridgeia piscesae]
MGEGLSMLFPHLPILHYPLPDEADQEKNVKLLLDGGITTTLLPLLAPPGDCAGKAAQVVAEITKTEDARGPSVQAGLVSPLLMLLKDDQRVQCQIQAGRALGNICYENDSGRHMVDSENGVEILLQLLRSQLDQSADGAARLRLVGCGFLLNLANTQGRDLSSCSVQRPIGLTAGDSASPTDTDSVRMITLKIKFDTNAKKESIQEKALNLGVLDILDDYLKKHSSDDGICQMVLLTIGCLSDSALGQEKLCTCDLPVTIVRLLGSGVSTELQEAALDLLANLAENDGVKVQLARSELKNGSLLSLLETTSKGTCESDENLQLEKLVADLVVLLLTGDESMELLYDEGKGVVFEQVLRWVQSPKEHLRSSGVLAIGNFARNGSHCKQLLFVARHCKQLLFAGSHSKQLLFVDSHCKQLLFADSHCKQLLFADSHCKKLLFADSQCSHCKQLLFVARYCKQLLFADSHCKQLLFADSHCKQLLFADSHCSHSKQLLFVDSHCKQLLFADSHCKQLLFADSHCKKLLFADSQCSHCKQLLFVARYCKQLLFADSHCKKLLFVDSHCKQLLFADSHYSHCKQLVKAGITEQLVATLQEQAGGGDMADNPALLHAVFSALRNLAIPAINKPVMLKCGLIDGVLPHLKVDLAAVQFKLLGTLRMIIDGQESAAVTLGTNESLLQQLMEWCKVEEHAGVKGEASRLVASLVKHSRSSTVMKNIVSHGGIVPLVNMATSEHVMMQNEALVAMTMISVSILDDAAAALVDSELVPILKTMLSSDKTQLEILCNTLTLARNVAVSNELKQKLVAAEVPAIVKNLQSHSEAKVQTVAKALSSVLDK